MASWKKKENEYNVHENVQKRKSEKKHLMGIKTARAVERFLNITRH